MSDTDSDVGDANSIISTSVLLGYAEEQPTEDPISQLGGTPKWMHAASPADSRLAKCSTCNKLMPLLLQLNGDIPETPHERVFYVWACRHKTCWRKKGSVRAFRGVRVVKPTEPEQKKKKDKAEAPPPPPAEKKKQPINTGAFLFGGGGGGGGGPPTANPFSQGNPFASPSSPQPSNPFAPSTTTTTTTTAAATPPPPPKTEPLTTFASALSHNLPKPAQPSPQFYGPAEPWPSPLPHTYPSYHLDAEHEQLDTRAPALPKNVHIVDTDEYADTPMSNTADAGGESSADKTFQKFADRVEQNPEQVLRYERKGTPLLYSKDDEIGRLLVGADGEVTMKRVPPCGACRAQRVFEFQLMPYAISMLEKDEAGLDGMEWGTIIVATCVCVPAALDANGVGYVEEWAGAQWESMK